MSSNSQNDVAKIASPPDGLTRCNDGNGTRTCAPRRTEPEAGHRAACWRRGAERWHVLPGQARTWTVLMLWLQPGWMTGSPSGRRVVLACSGCGALLLYTVKSWCSGIRNLCSDLGGAMGIRTPDLLHAISRQAIHESASPQV